MSNHTHYRILAAEAALNTAPEPNAEPEKKPEPELTFSQRYEAKMQAKKHMGKGNIANARDAIKYLQGCDSHEQAKLFVKSLQPKY